MNTPIPTISGGRPPGLAQIGLGLFVVGQLVFLLAANFLGLAEDTRASVRRTLLANGMVESQGALDQVYDRVPLVTAPARRWSELTGQDQHWSMFAPQVAPQAAFLSVELRWNDDLPGRLQPSWLAPLAAAGLLQETSLWRAVLLAQPERVELRAEVEPENRSSFFRPFGSFRLQTYETKLCRPFMVWDEEAVARDPEAWQAHATSNFRKNWQPMYAYLHHGLREFQRLHPERPRPSQVILVVRLHCIAPPEAGSQGWHEIVELPVARWRPGVEPQAGSLPIEVYDQVARRFKPVVQTEGNSHG